MGKKSRRNPEKAKARKEARALARAASKKAPGIRHNVTDHLPATFVHPADDPEHAPVSDGEFAVRQMRDAFQQMVPLPIVRDLWRRNMPPVDGAAATAAVACALAPAARPGAKHASGPAVPNSPPPSAHTLMPISRVGNTSFVEKLRSSA